MSIEFNHTLVHAKDIWAAAGIPGEINHGDGGRGLLLPKVRTATGLESITCPYGSGA